MTDTRMPDILDPIQLKRIESVHGGFLYQHLYGVACLLTAASAGVRTVTMEYDEDIELEHDSGDRVYIQVKTRARPLVASDISSALERFNLLRREHAQGRRPGQASFALVTNTVLGPELTTSVAAGAFPADICFVTPADADPSVDRLPPSWPGLEGAIRWCVERAGHVPLRLISPDTLVWKLAGRIQLAAAGQAPGHAFAAAALPALFEQLVVQLQRFPTPPAIYRPLEDEPSLTSPARVRIITGHSGAGKSAWAAQAALHAPRHCAYFDVGDLPGAAIAASLVREMAAQWMPPDTNGLNRILLPGPTGLEPLRALDRFMNDAGIAASVVIDNAHRVPPHDLRALIDATQQVAFVFLGQPSTSIATLEAITGLEQERLQGWGMDQAAAEMHALSARASAPTVGRLLALTGGLPLYVRNAGQLSVGQYAGDVAALCSAIESQTHLVSTAQELVLRQAFDTLPDPVQDCVAILSLSDVPLRVREAATLVAAAFGNHATSVESALRILSPLGVVRIDGARRIQIHDAFRVLGQGRLAACTPATAQAGWSALKTLIIESFEEVPDGTRFPLLVRALVALGDIEALLDLATEELFHELGVDAGMWAAIEATAVDLTRPPEQRFHALDALMIAAFRADEFVGINDRLITMEALARDHALGDREQLVVALHRMAVESERGDITATRRAADAASDLAKRVPGANRVLRYNIAVARFKVGDFARAQTEALTLVGEYYDLLDLEAEDVVMASNAAIAEKLTRGPTTADDLKHLGDTLDLMARSANRLGRPSGLARIHALKFYGLAQAVDSLVRVGQDVVDEFIQRRDVVGARQVIEEHLLPGVSAYKLLGRFVQVRGQYAVVLAYCGQHVAAAQTLAQLEPYRGELSARQCTELDGQAVLVRKLRWLGTSLTKFTARFTSHAERNKVSRNEPCPCGSGVKFKRCHGRT